MLDHLRRPLDRAYEHLLASELDETPAHVAVIQDGNRRYASQQGNKPTDGHQAGARTTESVLEWCDELNIEELTLYAFSTENFERPPDEREALFDLIETKLREFADHERVHDSKVRIRAIGEVSKLPDRVQEAVAYADKRTRGYDQFHLNVALAYGGRRELLVAAQHIAEAVQSGTYTPEEVDIDTVEDALYDGPTRDVDLIVRTGGDERTSNFLPWQANGNEAAVYFCTPYWPEFRKIDFLRGIRTYEHRQQTWRRSRARRALVLVRALSGVELDEARTVLGRFRDTLPSGERDAADREAVDTDASEHPAD